MDRMLSELKATSTASGILENWPLKVFIAGIQLVGCRNGGSSGEDGDKRCYQLGKGSEGIPNAAARP